MWVSCAVVFTHIELVSVSANQWQALCHMTWVYLWSMTSSLFHGVFYHVGGAGVTFISVRQNALSNVYEDRRDLETCSRQNSPLWSSLFTKTHWVWPYGHLECALRWMIRTGVSVKLWTWIVPYWWFWSFFKFMCTPLLNRLKIVMVYFLYEGNLYCQRFVAVKAKAGIFSV